jgi:hypothetical protein
VRDIEAVPGKEEEAQLGYGHTYCGDSGQRCYHRPARDVAMLMNLSCARTICALPAICNIIYTVASNEVRTVFWC